LKKYNLKIFDGAEHDAYYKRYIPVFYVAKRLNRSTFKQVDSLTVCREVLSDNIYDCLDYGIKNPGIVVSLLYGERHGKIKADESANEEWMSTAEYMLNALEGQYGWRRSRVYKVRNDKLSKRCHTFLFVVSPKWLRSPELISACSLIMRICRHYKVIKECKDFSNREALIKLAKEVSKSRRTASLPGLTPESKNVEGCRIFHRQILADKKDFVLFAKHIHTVLENYSYLYGRRNAMKNFEESEQEYGIRHLDFVLGRYLKYWKEHRKSSLTVDRWLKVHNL
jgi:hypothetical protein